MDRKYRPRIVHIFFWILSCSLLHCVCDWAEVLFTFWNDLDAAYLHMYDEKVLNHAYFFSQTRLFFPLKGGKGQIHQINTFSYFPSWLFSYQKQASRALESVLTLHTVKNLLENFGLLIFSALIFNLTQATKRFF